MDTATGTDLGSVPLVNGTASLDTIFTLGIGSHTITAIYSGDGNYASGIETFDLTVTNARTTTVVKATLIPWPLERTVVLRAHGHSRPGLARPRCPAWSSSPSTA